MAAPWLETETLPYAPPPETLQDLLAREDGARLQGTWDFLTGTRVAQATFAGDHFTIRFSTGEVYSGTFALRPLHHPKAIDLFIEQGPERHRGKVCLGIYLVDGRHLLLCPGVPGSGERPRFFPRRDDKSRLTLLFRRHRDAA